MIWSINGVVVHSNFIAEYEGYARERVIVLRCDNGQEVAVNDYYLLDVSVEPGDRCQLVIHASAIYRLAFLDDRNKREEGLMGIGMVSDVGWHAASESFSHASLSLVDHKPWVVVDLPFGSVLVGRAEFERAPAVGERVGWEYARLDLLALV